MPILTLEKQKSLAQEGRIRIGIKKPTADGKKSYPSSIDTFRFTSANRALIEAVAKVYGGDVKAWSPKAGVSEWEVITAQSQIKVVVSTEQSLMQWYELWSKGGCQRRCDGCECSLADPTGEKEPEMVPCLCDEDNRECKPMTRLKVMLAEIPSIGLWRFDSGGGIFAKEAAAAIDMLASLLPLGMPVFMTMTLTKKEIKKPGKPPEKFPVVQLAIDPNPPNFAELIARVQQSAFVMPEQPQALQQASTPQLAAANPRQVPDEELEDPREIRSRLKLTEADDEEIKTRILGKQKYTAFLLAAWKAGARDVGGLIQFLNAGEPKA